MDLRLRAHIDAARRLVEDDDVGLSLQPSREDGLLLVPAAESADGLSHRLCPDIAGLHGVADGGVFFVRADHSPAREQIGEPDADGVADGMIEHEALAFAFLGKVNHSSGQRFVGAARGP